MQPRWPVWLLTASVPLALLGLAPVTDGNTMKPPRVEVTLELPPPAAESTDTAAPAGPAPAAPRADASRDPEPTASAEGRTELIRLSVAAGDSLYNLFKRHDIPLADLAALLDDKKAKRRLSRLVPGQRVDLHVAGEPRRVEGLDLEVGSSRVLRLRRGTGGFESTLIDATLDAPPTPSAPAAPDGRAARAPESPPEGATAREITVRPGESLYLIFQREKLSLRDLAGMLSAGDDAHTLKRLRPGEKLRIWADGDGAVARLMLPIGLEKSLRIARVGDAFESKVEETPLERRIAHAAGTIDSSLFLAGQAANLSDRLIMEMVEIFGWDVDFALDIRRGDHFAVMHEELFRDGEKVADGNIVAAEFVNQGRVIRAVRFVDETGRAEYYTPEGLSLRKAFLRTPVQFSRISSRFTTSRYHPVLHKLRAHRGVDYAAPRGTPVKASGDGKLVLVGRKGGYGKTVVIQHGSAYSTLYAHLSRFARGIRTGKRVRQGDVIGYVGSTGLATGPHLHYEFRVRSVHRDPLRVKLPKAAPIPAHYRDDFLSHAAGLVSHLDRIARLRLADLNH